MELESEAARVLVVDDSEVNRTALTRLLQRLGHDVMTAADGHAALDALETAREIDLVLLDVEMPGMSGIELLEAIRANRRFHHIPVVMVSGVGDVGAVARCIGAGADDFIHKPFEPRLLRARVGSSLARKRLHDLQQKYTAQLEAEEATSKRLISAMLPVAIARRLRNGETLIAERFEDVSVLFADIVGFTGRAARTSPEDLVANLNVIFSRCDELAAAHGLEKIKTIGDAYMAAGNIPEPCEGHLLAMARFALDLLDTLRAERGLELRIGIHCGPAVAGVIGTTKPAYDVWGDTINLASRLESHGVPGRVQVSSSVRRRLAGCMLFEKRGTLQVKGRGEIEAHFLVGEPLC